MEAIHFIQFHAPKVTFMHDNDRPHSAAITRQFFATNNVNVLDWPANSPDLNPKEQVRDESERLVSRNHAIHTVNYLAGTLQAEQAILPVLFVQHYVNSMRRHITAHIAQNGVHMRY